MAALLLQELEPSEISKLPKTIQNKLEKILSDQQYKIDSLKAQQEQFRVDSGKSFGVTPLAGRASVLDSGLSGCLGESQQVRSACGLVINLAFELQ